MFKLTIVLTVLFIVCSCCSATGFSQSSGSPGAQGSGSQSATPKNKVRVLSPGAAGRVYRLLRNSVNPGDDDDMFIDEDTQKRNFDDYGHMRFGKRQAGGRDFDDYGHMRFGKRQGGQTDDYGIGLRFGK